MLLLFSELFNRSNYETVCLDQETGSWNDQSTLNCLTKKVNKFLLNKFLYFHSDYGGELTKCNGHFINPKCVCAYEMYTLGVVDICQISAPNENGSLDHTDGKTPYLMIGWVHYFIVFYPSGTTDPYNDLFLRLEYLEKWIMIFFSVSFCIRYSYSHAGPCQNGGELVKSKDLAIDAKCRCKEGFYGEFCDTVSRVCVFTVISVKV